MVGLLYTLLLAAVQGVTEWLSVSSSGHLAILQNVFKIPVSEAVFLDVTNVKRYVLLMITKNQER